MRTIKEAVRLFDLKEPEASPPAGSADRPETHVPWRFSDAGRNACGNARDGRRPKTFTSSPRWHMCTC